jgi:hypothetical protein
MFPKISKKLACTVLRLSEHLFLVAHGWEKVGPDRWDAPLGYPARHKDAVSQGHAVNSQRFWSRASRPHLWEK